MARAAAGPVPVVVMGLGYLGQEVLRAVQASPEVKLVGAVDGHPERAGRRLSEVVGGAPAGMRVVPSLEALARARGAAAVLLHTTGSRLAEVEEELLRAVRLGYSVASTCEELAFPYLKHPEAAARLERAAQRAEVAVVGAGLNPGFVFDRLVATLGQAVGPVVHAAGQRVVDARTLREAQQRSLGAGLSEEEFFEWLEREEVGQVGLVESAALCALGLGLDCDDFEEEVAPVLAEEDIVGGAFPVKKGRVAGIFQSAVGLEEGQERVRLELTLAVGAEGPGDRLVLQADPPLRVDIPGGLPGERATANIVVNVAPRLTAAEPGLLTVLELPAGR